MFTHHMVRAIRINVTQTSFASKKTCGLCSSAKLSAPLSPSASMWPGARQEDVACTSLLVMARRTQGVMGKSAIGPTTRRCVHVFGMISSAEVSGRKTKTAAMQMLPVFGQDSRRSARLPQLQHCHQLHGTANMVQDIQDLIVLETTSVMK